MPGPLTLIGSGETAPSMVTLHQALIQSHTESPFAVFLDTPAAFEMGLSQIQARFGRYFEDHVGIPLHIVSEANPSPSPQETAQNLALVQAGTYFIAGPGSASYAVHRWKDSLPFAAMLERWKEGAALTFASAAAVAISQHALPVYEIYKVGQELHWMAGLDLLGPLGYPLTIIPHWNNQEGGTHDTRACYMGMQRFKKLRTLLPASHVILGIDEHTACTLDFATQRVTVRGKGGVTILRGDTAQSYSSGETFPLLAFEPDDLAQAAVRPAGHDPASPAPLHSLAQASSAIAAGKISRGLRSAAEHCPDSVAALLHQAAQACDEMQTSDEALKPYLDLLLDVRSQLRDSQAWDLADEIRARLEAMGIQVQDGNQGPRWMRGGNS